MSLSRPSSPLYLCYKDSPVEFMLLRLAGMTAEAFEKYAEDLARQNGVDPSTTHLVRLDGKTQSEIESLMRDLDLITPENESEVLMDISDLGAPRV